jgi:hypothetical protein
LQDKDSSQTPELRDTPTPANHRHYVMILTAAGENEFFQKNQQLGVPAYKRFFKLKNASVPADGGWVRNCS